mmetsp:Transcript_11314/g.21316  ORF Transcript_11314/g.21316 Transcript_11314/m.21316 type:complete len:225 (+) Transcript_11314:421-1095(+)
MPIKQLRRHVPRRAGFRSSAADVRALHGLRDTKITKLGGQVLIEHNVGTLEVTMHKRRPLSVQERDSFHHLQEQLVFLSLGEHGPLDMKQVVQRTAGRQLRHDAQRWWLKGHPNEANEPLMPEGLQVADLLLELCQVGLRDATALHRMQLLDGNLLWETAKHAAMDGAKAPGAQELAELNVGNSKPVACANAKRLSYDGLRQLHRHWPRSSQRALLVWQLRRPW